MINIFFKFWKITSVVLLTIIILFCYANLPDNIAINFNENGNPEGFINKQQFFYWSAGVVFFINTLVSLLQNAVLKINFKALNPNSQWAKEPEALKNLLKGWFQGFLAVINTYLIFVILGINNINSDKAQTLDFNYNWLIVLGIIILIVIIFSLPIRLLYTQPAKEN